MTDDELESDDVNVNIFGPGAPREVATMKPPARPAARAAEESQIEQDNVDQSLFVSDKSDGAAPITPIKKANTKRNLYVYTKTEEAAKAGLELLARQHFLSNLDRRLYDKPVKAIFPGMSPTNPIYQDGLKKCHDDMKNWKACIIKAADAFSLTWACSHPDKAIGACTNFKQLRKQLKADFQLQWIRKIFRFTDKHINLEAASTDGITFLKSTYLLRLWAYTNAL
jgi:hypothetical protein